MIGLVLTIAAVVLAVWAALADAGQVTVGASFQLLCLSVACIAAAGLPWWRKP